MDLTNKRICIVSYAKYMEQKKFGRLINSYDIIVRINNGVNIANKKHFGERTDVFSGNFFGGKNKIIISTWNYLNPKNKKNNIFKVLKELNIKNVLINNKFGNRFDIINECRKQKLNILVNPSITTRLPITTGLQAIIHLLYLKPKELMIIGFDFTTNFHKDYEFFYRLCRNDVKSNERLNKNYEDSESLRHSTLFEKYVLKKLWKQYNFRVDQFLKNILDNFNIDNMDNNILELKINKTYKDIYDNYIISLIETGKLYNIIL